VANLVEQLVEMVPGVTWAFEAAHVDDERLGGKLHERRGRPAPKHHALARVHAITNVESSVERVMLSRVILAIGRSYLKISNN